MIKIAIMEDDIQELKNLKECINKYFADKGLEYHIAVSYTHLDVYKRQAIKKAILLLFQLRFLIAVLKG